MSWFVDVSFSRLQTFCINVLKCGPTPKHIAVIMDGNRRYATKACLNKFEGHTKGFEKLAETLQWCLKLGITELTLYAFSIENFKRDEEEVEDLFKLLKEKFQRLLTDDKEKLMEDGVCIRVIGNLSLLPEDIRKLIAEVMLMTKDNNKIFINMALAYTSRDEIATTIKHVVEGVKKGHIRVEDIDEALFERCLFTNNPDVLIRTSGEVRFSDFLLWQSSRNTLISFHKTLWPGFSIWQLIGIVFLYQSWYNIVKRQVLSYTRGTKHCNKRVEIFLKSLEYKRISQLQAYART